MCANAAAGIEPCDGISISDLCVFNNSAEGRASPSVCIHFVAIVNKFRDYLHTQYIMDMNEEIVHHRIFMIWIVIVELVLL